MAQPSEMRLLVADLREEQMSLRYYADTDSRYFGLKRSPGTETREVSDRLNVDLDAAGEVEGFDIHD